MKMMQLLNRQAEYNAWINAKLYAVCASIPDGDRKKNLGVFFKSIHGTLNHNLLGDRLWLGRFRKDPFKVDSLAEELYSDFDQLQKEREITDKVICDWVVSLTNGVLCSSEQLGGFFGCFCRQWSDRFSNSFFVYSAVCVTGFRNDIN